MQRRKGRENERLHREGPVQPFILDLENLYRRLKVKVLSNLSAGIQNQFLEPEAFGELTEPVQGELQIQQR